MPLSISPDTTKRLLASIKRFSAEHLDQEMGDLRAALFLDFCLQEIGPPIYNQAIADAQRYMQERAADLDGVCHQPEGSYWTAQAGKRRKP